MHAAAGRGRGPLARGFVPTVRNRVPVAHRPGTTMAARTVVPVGYIWPGQDRLLPRSHTPHGYGPVGRPFGVAFCLQGPDLGVP